MKMTASDYARLKTAIGAGLTKAGEKLPAVSARYAEAGLSPMRLRWDLLHLSRIKIGDGRGVRGDLDLYAYLDDTHIDTALRRIVVELAAEAAQSEVAVVC